MRHQHPHPHPRHHHHHHHRHHHQHPSWRPQPLRTPRGVEAEGDVDFDDGLLPEEEEEDVEMLSDDKVFQALNEDLNAM